MKNCISCGELKPLDEFSKHSGMKDGHLNKCKTCCSKYSRELYKKKMENIDFVMKERKRSEIKRLKNRDSPKPLRKRLPQTYGETWKNHYERYPEKYVVRNIAQRIRSKIKGNQLHHWSYKVENAKSFIDLSKKDHYKAHQNLIYEQEYMCYKTLSGYLLDTKDKHIEYLKSIGIKIYSS